MAFEIPLEADRVDDFNLFSTIVRGTAMWLLGGDKQDEEEQDTGRLQKETTLLMEGNDNQTSTAADDESGSNSGEPRYTLKRSYSKRGTLKKPAAPSMIGSDCSEVHESLDALCLEQQQQHNLPLGQRKKELSWSDESGKDLELYGDESALHEPKPATEQPVRSAMSRSRSRRFDSEEENSSSQTEQAQKYLPMVGPETNTVLKPTKPYTAHPGADPFSTNHNHSGIESPQWGWYIRTTPPTPEMYYARPQKTRKPTDSSSDTSLSSSSSATATMDPAVAAAGIGSKYQPNPVFQDLQGKNKGAPMNWPSVPL